MANVINVNPIKLDTVAAATGNVVVITGIIVVASADVWSAIINDNYGNRVFRADSSLTNHRSVFFSPSKPFPARGLVVATLTNIAEILVYTE